MPSSSRIAICLLVLLGVSASRAAASVCYTCTYELDPTIFRCVPNAIVGATFCEAQSSSTGGYCTTGAYDCVAYDDAATIRADGSKVSFNLSAISGAGSAERLRSCSGQLLVVTDVRIEESIVRTIRI